MRKTTFVDLLGQKVSLECNYGIIPVSEVPADPERFTELCRLGCPYFGRSYSCPPCSPTLNECTKGFESMLVLMFRANLGCMESPSGEKWISFEEFDRILNIRIDTVMRSLEGRLGTKYIAARSCRLCPACEKVKGRPCPRPNDIRNCAVSLGIDCEKLAKDLFGIPLSWKKGNKSQEYLSFICALPLKSDISDKLARDETELLIGKFN